MEEAIISNEICSLSMVKRVAAMLDLDMQAFVEGDLLPKGWHFFMLAGATQKSNLRQDGFPGLGVPMPDLGNLPRLLLGGRTVQYFGNILIGAVVERKSFIKTVSEKTKPSGRMAIVTIQHELRAVLEDSPAIIETQTYILKEIRNNQLGIRSEELGIEDNSANEFLIPNSNNLIPNSQITNSFTPDETLLFQYSALGFNSHKIHLDRDYAQNIEGLPDLVVNGGLSTLLLTEFMRTDLGLEFQEINVKHIAPLYCNRPLTMSFEQGLLKVYDDKNVVAVELNYD